MPPVTGIGSPGRFSRPRMLDTVLTPVRGVALLLCRRSFTGHGQNARHGLVWDAQSGIQCRWSTEFGTPRCMALAGRWLSTPSHPGGVGAPKS
jgi:hypothetical protein